MVRGARQIDQHRRSETKIKRRKLKGYDKFQQAYLRVAGRDWKKWLETGDNAKLLFAEIKKHLFDLGPPTPPRPIGKRTGREEFFKKLGDGYFEIAKSQDALKDIQFYIGRFPYHKAPVSKHRYLEFHVEVFLQEIYILQSRMLNYLTMLERQYRKDPRRPAIQELCARLRELVVTAFKKIVDSRGIHVHQYRAYDTQVDRLGGIKLQARMLNNKNKRVFDVYYEAEYRSSRSRWKKTITTANASIVQVFDMFFDGIYAITFNKNGTVRYPSRLKF